VHARRLALRGLIIYFTTHLCFITTQDGSILQKFYRKLFDSWCRVKNRYTYKKREFFDEILFCEKNFSKRFPKI